MNICILKKMTIFLMVFACIAASNAHAEKINKPGDFAEKMVIMMKNKNSEGVIKLVKDNPKTSVTVFNNLLDAMEAKILKGVSVKSPEVRLANGMAQIIALVHQQKLDNPALVKQYNTRLEQIKKKIESKNKEDKK